MSDRVIPLAAMEKIMKNAGADRVADSAKSALKSVLEEYGEDISRRAIQLSKHAGRKTIKSEDISLATKEI